MISGRLFRSPDVPPADLPGRFVFIAGSIEMGRAELWQPRVAERFISSGINVFDPRRDDWDADLDQDPTPGTVFNQQVTWELENIQRADAVFFRLCGGETMAIVSMLEMGICFGSGKPIVIQADRDYMRYGNIAVTARRFGVPVFNDEDEAISLMLQLPALKR